MTLYIVIGGIPLKDSIGPLWTFTGLQELGRTTDRAEANLLASQSSYAECGGLIHIVKVDLDRPTENEEEGEK